MVLFLFSLSCNNEKTDRYVRSVLTGSYEGGKNGVSLRARKPDLPKEGT